jgi:hypothetical protein
MKFLVGFKPKNPEKYNYIEELRCTSRKEITKQSLENYYNNKGNGYFNYKDFDSYYLTTRDYWKTFCSDFIETENGFSFISVMTLCYIDINSIQDLIDLSLEMKNDLVISGIEKTIGLTMED